MGTPHVIIRSQHILPDDRILLSYAGLPPHNQAIVALSREPHPYPDHYRVGYLPPPRPISFLFLLPPLRF